ncbi:MAG TPA: hypothetical protein ENK57_06685 [Polyangiaceae bacterium]|nr:hypothetical protein [Polyangiaceae bacterium]
MRRLGWLVALATVGSAGCHGCDETKPNDVAGEDPSCSVAITAGRGTHRVSEKRAGRTKKAMRKLLFERGCTKICEADGVAKSTMKACVARCQADIVGDQIGVRFRCD